VGERNCSLIAFLRGVQKAQGGMGNTGVEVSIRWGLLAQMKAMSQFLLGLSQLCFNCLIGI
jgi:hypothetical protein